MQRFSSRFHTPTLGWAAEALSDLPIWGQRTVQLACSDELTSHHSTSHVVVVVVSWKRSALDPCSTASWTTHSCSKRTKFSPFFFSPRGPKSVSGRPHEGRHYARFFPGFSVATFSFFFCTCPHGCCFRFAPAFFLLHFGSSAFSRSHFPAAVSPLVPVSGSVVWGLLPSLGCAFSPLFLVVFFVGSPSSLPRYHGGGSTTRRRTRHGRGSDRWLWFCFFWDKGWFG